MQKFLPKFCSIVLLFVLFVISFSLPQPVQAARNVDSATLNGASSVTVAPSASITASVTVTTSGTANDWQSTSWDISGANCVDHADHTSVGTYNESFSITAPSSPGTYSVSFIAYGNNGCGTGASNTYTMTDAITVAEAAATPTPDPNASASPASSATSITSTSSGTTYYPSVTLNAYSPDPTRNTSLTFTGTSKVEQGTIKNIQYSVDGGTNWLNATTTDGGFDEASEDYSFTATFVEGVHTIKVRAKSAVDIETQSSSYATDTVTVVTTPPTVTLDDFKVSQTNNQTPSISGSASSKLVSISKVEISLDGGSTWLPAKLAGNKFSLTTETLEDGNYEVKARATDTVGNRGESKTQTLIIDTIPPIIGGNMISIGPQLLTPDENGVIKTVAGTEITLTTSMKGGVTEAKIISGETEFPLEKLAGTNLWSTKLVYQSSGEHLLTVVSLDGAGNRTEREINYILVKDSGKIHRNESDETVPEAQIRVYFFNIVNQTWVLWDGVSFGQKNPQTTSENGNYSFLVPPGKYYLEINATGFKTARSQILELKENTILNFDFPLQSKPMFRFHLPFIGELVLSLPSFAPPETIAVASQTTTSTQLTSKLKSGTAAPHLKLSNPDGKLTDVASDKKHVLSFVSTWSAQSLEQIPIFNAVQKEITEEEALDVIFLQESAGAVQTFMRRGGYSFTALADKDGESTNDYAITTLPQHFFIDTSGTLLEVYNGVLSKEELLGKLNKLQ